MPRKPIRPWHWRLMNGRYYLFMCTLTRRKQHFTQILPTLQIFLLGSFSNDCGEKKKKIKVALPTDCRLNSWIKRKYHGCQNSVAISCWQKRKNLNLMDPHLLQADIISCEEHGPWAIFFFPAQEPQALAKF